MIKSRLFVSVLILGVAITSLSFAGRPAQTKAAEQGVQAPEIPKPAPQIASGAWATG
jgi:hypothetical protein